MGSGGKGLSVDLFVNAITKEAEAKINSLLSYLQGLDSDINVDLDIRSNIKKTLDEIKELNKAINGVAASSKKMGKIGESFVGKDGLKEINESLGAIDKYNKSLKNAGQRPFKSVEESLARMMNSLEKIEIQFRDVNFGNLNNVGIDNFNGALEKLRGEIVAIKDDFEGLTNVRPFESVKQDLDSVNKQIEETSKSIEKRDKLQKQFTKREKRSPTGEYYSGGYATTGVNTYWNKAQGFGKRLRGGGVLPYIDEEGFQRLSKEEKLEYVVEPKFDTSKFLSDVKEFVRVGGDIDIAIPVTYVDDEGKNFKTSYTIRETLEDMAEMSYDKDVKGMTDEILKMSKATKLADDQMEKLLVRRERLEGDLSRSKLKKGIDVAGGAKNAQETNEQLNKTTEKAKEAKEAIDGIDDVNLQMTGLAEIYESLQKIADSLKEITAAFGNAESALTFDTLTGSLKQISSLLDEIKQKDFNAVMRQATDINDPLELQRDRYFNAYEKAMGVDKMDKYGLTPHGVLTSIFDRTSGIHGYDVEDFYKKFGVSSIKGISDPKEQIKRIQEFLGYAKKAREIQKEQLKAYQDQQKEIKAQKKVLSKEEFDDYMKGLYIQKDPRKTSMWDYLNDVTKSTPSTKWSDVKKNVRNDYAKRVEEEAKAVADAAKIGANSIDSINAANAHINTASFDNLIGVFKQIQDSAEATAKSIQQAGDAITAEGVSANNAAKYKEAFADANKKVAESGEKTAKGTEKAAKGVKQETDAVKKIDGMSPDDALRMGASAGLYRRQKEATKKAEQQRKSTASSANPENYATAIDRELRLEEARLRKERATSEGRNQKEKSSYLNEEAESALRAAQSVDKLAQAEKEEAQASEAATKRYTHAQSNNAWSRYGTAANKERLQQKKEAEAADRAKAITADAGVATSTKGSLSSLTSETKAFDKLAQSAEKAASAKKSFSEANGLVATGADVSSESIKKENNALKEAASNFKNGAKNANPNQSEDNDSSDVKGAKSALKRLYQENKTYNRLIKERSKLNLKMDENGNPIGVRNAYDQADFKRINGLLEESRKNAKLLQDSVKAYGADAVQQAMEEYEYREKISKLARSTQETVGKNEVSRMRSEQRSAESQMARYNLSLDKMIQGGKFTDAYTGEMEHLKERISKFGTDLTNNGWSEKLREEARNIQDAFDNINIGKGFERNKKAAEKSLEGLKAKIEKTLNVNSAMGKDFMSRYQDIKIKLNTVDSQENLNDLIAKMRQLDSELNKSGRTGKSFFEGLKDRFKSITQSAIAMYFSFYDVIRYTREAFNTLRELDTELVDLQKTTSMSTLDLNSFYKESNNIAKQMGVSTKEIINQASAWSRLGYSTKEQSEQMATLSSQFASISPGMETQQAQEGLVSMMKAYGVEVEDVEKGIMDKVNTLGNKFALSNQDIVEGMERSGAALAAQGTSLEDSLALFVGAQEVLQNAEKSGTALRSISMRIRGYDEETEQLSSDLANVNGEVADLTKTASNPNGISLFTDASQEHYKSLVQYLGELSDAWDEISEKNQQQLLQKLFAKTQAQAGAAIIKNFDQVRAALDAMGQSAGSADREMGIIEKSLDYKINAFKETWVGILQESADRGVVGGIIDSLTALSSAIKSISEVAKPLGSAGGILGLVMGFTGHGLFQSREDTLFPRLLGRTLDEYKSNRALGLTRRQSWMMNPIEAQNYSDLQNLKKFNEAYKNVDKTLPLTKQVGSLRNSYKSLSKEMQAVAIKEIKASGNLDGYIANMEKATQSSSKLVTGLRNFGAAIANMATFMLAGFAINLAIDRLNNLAHAVENTSEKANNAVTKFQDNMKTVTDHGKQIDTLSDQYQKLSKGVDAFGHNQSLSDTDYETYLETVSTIGDMYPELIKGHNDEGTAILSLRDNVDALTEAYEREKKAAYDAMIVGKGEDGEGSIKDVLQNFKNQRKAENNAGAVVGRIWESIPFIGRKVQPGKGTLSYGVTKEILETIDKMDPKEVRQYLKDLNAAGFARHRETDKLYKKYGIEANKAASYIKEQYGLDANSTDKEINNTKKAIAAGISSLDVTLKQSLQDVQTSTLAYLYNDTFYDSMSDKGKTFVQSLISSMSEETAQKIADSDDPMAAIENQFNKIMDYVKTNPDAEKIYDDILNVDKNEKSVESYWSQIKSLSSDIAAGTGEDIKHIQETMFNSDSFLTKYRAVKNLVSDEYDNMVKSLSVSDLEIASSLSVPDGVTLSWDELKTKIDEASTSAKALSFDFTSEQAKLTNIQTAISNASSGTGLIKAKSEDGETTTDDIENIKNTYAKAVEEIQRINGTVGEEFDWSGIFERSSLGIQVNTEALNKLQSVYEKITFRDLNNGLQAEKKALSDSAHDAKEYQKALKLAENAGRDFETITLNLTDGQKTLGELHIKNADELKKQADSMQASVDSHRSNIEAIKDEISQYEALTSAYNKWQIATQTTNPSAPFESVRTAKEQMDKAWEEGRINTDDFRQYVNMFAYEDLTTAPIEKLEAAWGHLDGQLDGTKKHISDFLQEGKKGAEAFFDAIKDAGYVTENKDGTFDIGDLSGLAKRWDVDGSFIDMLAKNLSEFGFEIHFENEPKSLANVNEELDNAVKGLDKFGVKKEELDKEAGIKILDDKGAIDYSNIEKATENAKEYKKEQQEIIKKGGEGAEQAQANINYVDAEMQSVILAQREAEKPAVLKIDADQVPRNIKPAVDAIQNYYDIKTQSELAPFDPEIKINEKDVQSAREAVEKQLSELTDDQKLALGIDPKLNIDELSDDQFESLLNQLNPDIEIPVKIRLAEDLNISGMIGGENVELTIKANTDEITDDVEKAKKDAEKDPLKLKTKIDDSEANKIGRNAFPTMGKPLDLGVKSSNNIDIIDSVFGPQEVHASERGGQFTEKNQYKELLADAKEYYSYYNEQLIKARQNNVDLNKTVYGNIDLNKRQRLEWTQDNVDKYSDILRSWGQNPQDFLGSYSTVDGTSSTWNINGKAVEIAFSPMLQTEHGAELLSQDTVTEYIDQIVSEANQDGRISKAEILALDKKGIGDINSLIADVGETAKKTGEAMHFGGEDGSLQDALNHIAKYAQEANIPLDQFIDKLDKINQKQSTGAATEAGEHEFETLPDKTAQDQEVNIEVDADTDEAEEKIEHVKKEGEGKIELKQEADTSQSEGKVSFVKSIASGVATLIQDAATGLANSKIGQVLNLGSRTTTMTQDADTSSAQGKVEQTHGEARKGEEFNLGANTGSADGSVSSTHSAARQSETFTVHADTSSAWSKIQSFVASARAAIAGAFSGPGGKDGSNKSGTSGKGKKKGKKKGRYLGTVGGYAYASGSSGSLNNSSFYDDFDYRDKVKNNELALTGELGKELVVYKDRWWTVGDNGAEFSAIPAGAIIFNHKQTEDLLSRGFTNGRAHVHGTAFSDSSVSSGRGTWAGGARDNNSNSGSSSSKSSSSSNSAAKTQQNAANKQSEAADKQKDAAEKAKEAADKAKEAIDKINTRFQNKIDLREAKAEGERLEYQYAESNSLLTEKRIKRHFDSENRIMAANFKDATTQARKMNAELEKQVKKGTIKKGSEDWYDIKKNIIEAKNAAKQYNIQILQNIRDQVKANQEVRLAKRDKKLEHIDNIQNGLGSAFTYQATASNNQLDLQNSLLDRSDKAYNEAVVSASTARNSARKSGLKTLSKDLKTKKAKNNSKYRTALKNAQKAMKAKQPISKKDMAAIAKYGKNGSRGNAYTRCLLYNTEIEALRDNIEERNLAIAQNRTKRNENINQKYENIATERNNSISLNTAIAQNKVGAAETNTVLSRNFKLNNQLLQNEENRLKVFQKDTTKYSNKIKSLGASKKLRKSRGVSYANSSKKTKAAVDKVIKKAVDCVKAGKRIPDKTLEKIEEYNHKQLIWVDFYNACVEYNEALENQRQAKYQRDVQKEATKRANAENALEQFNNIKKDYENQSQDIERNVNRMQKGVDYASAKGYVASEKYYQNMMENTNKNIKNVSDEREKLVKKLNKEIEAGHIDIGSDEWIEMKNAIADCDDKLLDLNKDLVDFENSIRQIKWDAFDRIIEKIGLIPDINNQVIDIMRAMHEDDLFDEDTGLINDYGMSISGLQMADLVAYEQQLVESNKKLADAREELAKDPNDTVAQDRYSDALKQNVEITNSLVSQKKAIVDLVKEGYDAQLKALQKIIDKRKEDMKLTKDAYEYEKTIRDKTKSVSSYQKQLAALAGDNSEEARAKIQKLQVELNKANEDLEETEYDKYISDQEEMLNNLYDDYENVLNERIKDVENIVGEVKTSLDENGKNIANTLGDQLTALGTSQITIDSILSEFQGNGPTTSNITSNINTAADTIRKAIDDSRLASEEFFNDYRESKRIETESNRANARYKLNTDSELSKSSTTAKGDFNIDELKKKADTTYETRADAYNTYKAKLKAADSYKTSSEYKNAKKNKSKNPSAWKNAQAKYNSLISEANKFKKAWEDAKKANTTAQNAYEKALQDRNIARTNFQNLYDETVTDDLMQIVREWFIDVFGIQPRVDANHMLYSANDADIKNRLKYWGVDNVTDADMAKYYDNLGLSGTYTGSEQNKKDMLEAIKAYGFKEGGTVGKAIKSSGEDGFILARTGEEVLSLEKIKEIQKAINGFKPIMDDMIAVQKTNNLPSIPNVAHNDVTIENPSLTLELPNVQSTEDFIKEIQDNKKMQNWIVSTVNTNMTGKNSFLNQRYHI